jgi:hypothetical protein
LFAVLYFQRVPDFYLSAQPLPSLANGSYERKAMRKAIMKKVFLAFYLSLSVAVAALVTPTSAWGQVPYNMTSSYYYNLYTAPKIKYYRHDKDTEKTNTRVPTKNIERNLPTTPSKPAIRASANNNPLPYRRDRSLSSKIREEFLAEFAKQIPSAAAGMRATAEQTDIVQMMAGFIQLQGLDSGSIDSLIALWYGQAWAIIHQKSLPTPQQYQGIADQIRTSMRESTEWNSMSDEKRQMFFERLVYPLFIQKANYQAYLKQGKTEYMVRMADAAQQSMRKAGIDLQNLRLSDNGFVGL